MRFVRRALGVEAFGLNWFELVRRVLPATSTTRRVSGQEEVSVVVRGSGLLRVDGEEVPVTVGSFIRFDPESTRCRRRRPGGMTFVSVGAPRGSYEPRGPF